MDLCLFFYISRCQAVFIFRFSLMSIFLFRISYDSIFLPLLYPSFKLFNYFNLYFNISFFSRNFSTRFLEAIAFCRFVSYCGDAKESSWTFVEKLMDSCRFWCDEWFSESECIVGASSGRVVGSTLSSMNSLSSL